MRNKDDYDNVPGTAADYDQVVLSDCCKTKDKLLELFADYGFQTKNDLEVTKDEPRCKVQEIPPPIIPLEAVQESEQADMSQNFLARKEGTYFYILHIKHVPFCK